MSEYWYVCDVCRDYKCYWDPIKGVVECEACAMTDEELDAVWSLLLKLVLIALAVSAFVMVPVIVLV